MITPSQMKPQDFLEFLSGLEGVIKAVSLDRLQVEAIIAKEEALKTVTGGLRMENSGVVTCGSRKNVFIMYCDSNYSRPEKITMEMIDDRGVLIGHDVPPSMIDQFKDRSDVIWFTDNFILYPAKMASYDAKMVMRACRMEWGLPEGMDAWSFYPSPETANMVNSWFGFTDRRMSTIILGVDGIETSDVSVPVSDMVEIPGAGCRHGEPSSQDTLYRCDLIGELLEILQLAFADQYLHAFVMVQMHVDGSVDHGLMVMLHVCDLVADRCHGMVVDHDDRSDHPFIVVLPFGLGERIAYEVPYGFRSADVALLGYGFIELFEKIGFQRDTNARNTFHGLDIGIPCLTSS